MADCEKNVDEALPVIPSLVAPSDLIWFTTADGTSARRTWANFLQAKPSDLEITVTESGGDINNGDTVVTIPEHIGYKMRVFRNYTPLPKDINQPQYFSYDILTGEYAFTPALTTDEFLIFQPI